MTNKSIMLMLDEAEEQSWWDKTKEFGRDFIKDPLNPFKSKLDRAKETAEELAKQAGLKEKTLWDKTKDSFKHTGDEIADFTKRNLPGVYDASKKVGQTVDDVGEHLGRNWAAYGTGAAALAAGLGAYKLRKKMKERQKQNA